jgi:hypothetical protein
VLSAHSIYDIREALEHDLAIFPFLDLTHQMEISSGVTELASRTQGAAIYCLLKGDYLGSAHYAQVAVHAWSCQTRIQRHLRRVA